MAKIILDAGHGGADSGAVFQERQEKDDNLRLALAVGQILEQKGVDIFYTRTEDVYNTPFEKSRIANEEDGDFLISFHRNSSPRSNQYSGVETLIYDLSGEKRNLAERINQNLEQAGYRNLGVQERPGLIILRRTRMPSVLVETGFLNNEADNELFEERFQEIAQAIANAVLDTVLNNENETEVRAFDCRYHVQTGAFRRLEYAEDQLYQLLAQNFPAYILREDSYYKVCVGAFRRQEDAKKTEQELKRRGYSAFVPG